MSTFSERYGYEKSTPIIIREELTGAVLNSLMNNFIDLYNRNGFSIDFFNGMNYNFARFYLNLKIENISRREYYYKYYIENEKIPWNKRIDAIEWIIGCHRKQISASIGGPYYSSRNEIALNQFIKNLNWEFERLNYGYRIIDDKFIETTSEIELSTINEALSSADETVIAHLSECLKLISPSNQQLSTRNAIKEAISAVELIARKVTNTKTLDYAFKQFRKLHPQIKSSMMSLYPYTNQPNTGARHAWMDQATEPTINEAVFVLVTACAFINYLTKLYN